MLLRYYIIEVSKTELFKTDAWPIIVFSVQAILVIAWFQLNIGLLTV